MRVAPRSGLVLKGIDVAADVVDRDYTGEIQVILVNNTSDPFAVQPNDRIAQLIAEHIATPQVKIVDKLPTTERGTQGFGSTGLKPPFIQLLDTTIRALRLANDKQAPAYIRLTNTDAISNTNEDDEVIVSYVPGTGQIWTADINQSAPEAFATLYIQTKINLAMSFAQEAGQQKEKAIIPEYLMQYKEVFEKKAAERFPKSRPYDHAIDLKPDFVP